MLQQIVLSFIIFIIFIDVTWTKKISTPPCANVMGLTVYIIYYKLYQLVDYQYVFYLHLLKANVESII